MRPKNIEFIKGSFLRDVKKYTIFKNYFKYVSKLLALLELKQTQNFYCYSITWLKVYLSDHAHEPFPMFILQQQQNLGKVIKYTDNVDLTL